MHYGKLLLMAVLHFIAMYVFMYAMVDTAANVYPNLNQLYMAALMTSPMLILELWLMGSMYPKKKLNIAIITAGALVLVCSFFFIRQQVAIGDTEFLKSMIPHHAGAILMCKKASIQDPEIQALCNTISTGQQKEINWMKTKLESLK